ncbi:S8 family serine peptidase [Thermoleophilia bacterium SCSIO 60948]|nr:S8 family serine peptidase [Thermoleophilia bacterium SCSIO 60948]
MRSLAPLATLLAALVALLAPAAASASDSIIVKYEDSASSTAVSKLTERLGLGETVGQVRRLGAEVVAVDGDAAAVAARVAQSDAVAYAEPNRTLRAEATPNDPLFGDLYGLEKIAAPTGWDNAGLGTFPATGGVKVGIVDTGILGSHEDLGQVTDCARSQGLLPIFSGTIQEGSCADDNGHGTHVAGTIAAKADNGVGVAGVSFNSPLAICKALGGALGSGSTADVANCITYLADKDAKVISMSLGGGDSQTLSDAVDYAWDGGNGSALIAAAGNDGDGTLNYPAAYDDVVSVAATDEADQRASFSNANADVEIAAPGVDITSTWNDGAYNTISGTSMATPHVAGVAAVIAGENPGLSAAGIVAELRGSVDDLGPAGRDPEYGFGRVNLAKATD